MPIAILPNWMQSLFFEAKKNFFVIQASWTWYHYMYPACGAALIYTLLLMIVVDPCDTEGEPGHKTYVWVGKHWEGGPAGVPLYRLEPNCEWESKKSIDPAQHGTKVSRNYWWWNDIPKIHRTELPTYKVTPKVTPTDSQTYDIRRRAARSFVQLHQHQSYYGSAMKVCPNIISIIKTGIMSALVAQLPAIPPNSAITNAQTNATLTSRRWVEK